MGTKPAPATPPSRGRGRPPGHPKSGGRKKGTPNRITGELRLWLGKLITKQRKQIEADLQAVEPGQRLVMLERLMQYVIPKKQAVRAEVENLTENELADLAALMLEKMSDE